MDPRVPVSLDELERITLTRTSSAKTNGGMDIMERNALSLTTLILPPWDIISRYGLTDTPVTEKLREELLPFNMTYSLSPPTSPQTSYGKTNQRY